MTHLNCGEGDKNSVLPDLELFALTQIRKPSKQTKKVHFTPVTVGAINNRLGKSKLSNLQILLDSGASSTILSGKYAKRLRKKKTKPQRWVTQAGTIKTNQRAKIDMILPELDATKIMTWYCHVDDSLVLGRYDMIIGRDLLSELCINLDFSTHTITCHGGAYEGCTAPMKDVDSINFNDSSDDVFAHEELWESEAVLESTKCARKILDAHYENSTSERLPLMQNI